MGRCYTGPEPEAELMLAANDELAHKRVAKSILEV